MFIDACERYLYHALQTFFGDQVGAHEEFEPATRGTLVRDVMNDPVFGDYGRLLLPVDRTIPEDMTLEDVGDVLVWYNYINPDTTVEIVNTLASVPPPATRSFTTSTLTKRKRRTRTRRTPACSSSGGNRAARLPSATPAAALSMWAPCRTASPHALELVQAGV